MNKTFTAKWNKYQEYEIYCNGEIFCHLSELDFETFKENFKQPIEVINEQ